MNIPAHRISIRVPGRFIRLLVSLLLCWPTGSIVAQTQTIDQARPLTRYQPGQSSSEATLLRFAQIIDGDGKVIQGRDIVVIDGHIAVIGDNLRPQFPKAQMLDLHQLYAVPGLIDTHVHVTYGLPGPGQGDAWSQLLEKTPPAQRLVAAIDNAQKMLANGVTTARDLFALDGVDFELRTLINTGVVAGPRLVLSGVGIHPMTLPQDTTDSAHRVRNLSAAARRVAASGAQWVKIFATTGTADDLTGEQIFFYPEIKAVVDIAHGAGLRVAVHSYSPDAVMDALRAGVDSIEHPVGVDSNTLQAWAKTDTFYVPTIDHNRYYAEHRNEYGYGKETEQMLHLFVQDNIKTLSQAHSAGVRIAFGSDAVMSMFGQNTRELEWFVEAGMTTSQALKAATYDAAALLGMEDQVGRLQPGYRADIVAVCGDPLTDIQSVTRRVALVMKAGAIVHYDKHNALCP
jgi:imidazolonepropionase-like amidohydrolase